MGVVRGFQIHPLVMEPMCMGQERTEEQGFLLN